MRYMIAQAYEPFVTTSLGGTATRERVVLRATGDSGWRISGHDVVARWSP